MGTLGHVLEVRVELVIGMLKMHCVNIPNCQGRNGCSVQGWGTAVGGFLKRERKGGHWVWGSESTADSVAQRCVYRNMY